MENPNRDPLPGNWFPLNNNPNQNFVSRTMFKIMDHMFKHPLYTFFKYQVQP